MASGGTGSLVIILAPSRRLIGHLHASIPPTPMESPPPKPGKMGRRTGHEYLEQRKRVNPAVIELGAPSCASGSLNTIQTTLFHFSTVACTHNCS